MMVIINAVNRNVVKCKHFIFKVENEMHVGERPAREIGLISLLSSPAALSTNTTTE